ncbi:MAG: hypothetical protein Q9228_004881 [Teloschistes exilis]
MRREHLPIEDLPAWAALSEVSYNGITVGRLSGDRGSGIIITAERIGDESIILTVPSHLILSLENVWIHAKSDQHLKEVLDAVGEYSRTSRGAILIFLLLQITHSATPDSEKVGVSNPLTQYVIFLPERVPLPTFWTEEERELLVGTSLEAALDAKLKSLDREFTHLQSSTASIGWCQKYWWSTESGTLTFDDWKQVDAMYRSRALDLPGTGHAMVPAIDMANHASGDATLALYDTDPEGDAVLILRSGKTLQANDEVTITYGDGKGACEMLFSYGFIEDTMTSARELFLDIGIPDDDPLKLAKKAVAKSAPGFKLFLKEESIAWEGDFVWLVCVNEEDGLNFRLLQTNDGGRELQVSWKDCEMHDVSKLRGLLEQDRLWEVFHLRVIATLQGRVEQQLRALESSKDRIESLEHLIESDIYRTALTLRKLEEELMLQASEEFEHKLSRRAFPRGYTESLEERVRSLENEVRELKDLLDEKDEKIDILSRIHSGSPVSRGRSSEAASNPCVDTKAAVAHETPKEDIFKVQQSPDLLNGDADSYFMGASSGRAFVDVFKAKIQQSSKQCPDIGTQTFFASCKSAAPSPIGSPVKSATFKAPPRLVSDQMVNIFFQEWAPLFPVLNRPTFLKLYTEYVADPESLENPHSIAQLNLVFGIAALSAEWNKQNAESFERQWRDAIEYILAENTLATLQCLVLAVMYCIAKADYNKLLHYKGMATSLSHRLGLHQSQKRFSLGALTSETRKKLFWTLYTLDCFSAAMLGLPKLLKEEDIHTEYPVDIDDENVSERGFQPTLPGESTRLSSALALFRGSRILAKVLDEIYPASLSYELSLQKIGGLSSELDTWLDSLPQHLRLQFVQDKPSTHVIGSRSPLLSLAYQYIRTLIHRPAAGSRLGSKASSSTVNLANASKHTIQIIQLLEERRMSFSFCLNKNELLLLSGFGLLFQGLDLNRRGKLMQDSERLVCSAIAILERNAALGSAEFKQLACAMITVDRNPNSRTGYKDSSNSRPRCGTVMETSATSAKPRRKQSHTMSARNSTGNIDTFKKGGDGDRRATIHAISAGPGDIAPSNVRHTVAAAISTSSNPQQYEEMGKGQLLSNTSSFDALNLDYLSFGNDHGSGPSYPSTDSRQPAKEVITEDFTRFLGGQPLQAPFSSLFPSADMFASYMTPSPPTTQLNWASDAWTVLPEAGKPTAPSIRSLTDEDVTSGEEFSIGDVGSEYRGVAMPSTDTFELEAFDVDHGT